MDEGFKRRHNWRLKSLALSTGKDPAAVPMSEAVGKVGRYFALG